jgi:rhodanese-related sulfurtransferase
MVGGSVISHIDWRHLRDDHAPPIPHEALARVLDFALRVPYDAKLYVHCQMGGSRSPAFAYLILRGKYGLGKEAALNALNRGFVHRKDHTPEKEPPYGHSPGHWTYMGNVEDYLAARGAE